MENQTKSDPVSERRYGNRRVQYIFWHPLWLYLGGLNRNSKSTPILYTMDFPGSEDFFWRPAICPKPCPSTVWSGFLDSLTRSLNSVTKQEVEDHFKSHGAGIIKEIKIMNGFGFIEYEDALDARDVVPGESLRKAWRCANIWQLSVCFIHTLVDWFLTSSRWIRTQRRTFDSSICPWTKKKRWLRTSGTSSTSSKENSLPITDYWTRPGYQLAGENLEPRKKGRNWQK